MLKQNTDREWQKFGKTDPYFGVIANQTYQTNYLSQEKKEAFFKTGYDYFSHILANIREHLDVNYTPKQALDFGCGVGRLVIPIAEVAELVTGVDVSESMLKEARKNCEEKGIKNVCFLNSDDHLSLLKGKYDFIHSFIVFQHLPTSRGEEILKTLTEHLETEGCCVVHFTYARDNAKKQSSLIQLTALLKKHMPFAKNLINFIKGRNFDYPDMQMNFYNLNKLFFLIQKQYIKDLYVEYTDHGGYLGILVYFKKPKST